MSYKPNLISSIVKKKSIMNGGILLISLFVVGCASSPNVVNSNNVIPNNEQVLETENTVERELIDNETKDKFSLFVDNYNKNAQTKISQLKDTSRLYKKEVELEGYRLVIEDLSPEFRINLEQTNETADAGMVAMKQILIDVAIALDSNLATDELEILYDELLNNTHMVETEIGEIKIDYYPDIMLSNGYSRGHIALSVFEK